MKNLVTFFPDWRGGDPYVHDLARELSAEGWRSRFVGRKGLLLALTAAIIGRGIVHLHWFEGFTPERHWFEGVVAWLYVPALWLAGRRGRVFWTVHNIVPHEGYAPLVGVRFLKILARSSSRILVHFDETRQAVEELFSARGKVSVIHAATFGHAHGPPVDRASARARISDQLTAGTMLFVQVGSLRAYKQPATTVQAFRDAAPSSALLLVSGLCVDEALRTDVIRVAANDPRITLHFDRLSNEDLVAALCAADWSICPYTTIDNPGAVNLSMAYDCPVIAPALGPVVEMTHGHPVMLYPPEGPARQHLACVIAKAAEMRLAPADGKSGLRVTRREQARQTSEQYIAARSRAAHSPASSA
jgi:glycosyltransferase involved in cell wall biosynthesis